MPHVAGLVAPGGLLILSLRHGPVPPAELAPVIGAEETIALARPHRLEPILNQHAPSAQNQPGVSWTRLAFRKT